MFETHSEEWERVGLAVDVNQKSVQSARRRVVLEIALFVAAIVVYDNYKIMVPRRSEAGNAPALAS